MTQDPSWHLHQVQNELDSMERGAASMERQMDRLIYENNELRRKVTELELENVNLHDMIDELSRED